VDEVSPKGGGRPGLRKGPLSSAQGKRSFFCWVQEKKRALCQRVVLKGQKEEEEPSRVRSEKRKKELIEARWWRSRLSDREGGGDFFFWRISSRATEEVSFRGERR